MSVDIDLVYLNGAEPREVASPAIAAGLLRTAARLEARKPTVQPVRTGADLESKLLVMEGHSGLILKIEVNTAFRGTVLPVKTQRPASVATAQKFGVQVYE